MTDDRVHVPLSPRQIREYDLPYAGWSRRGLDPETVYRLLYRLADQIAVQNATLRALLEENERVKRALQHRQNGNGRRKAPAPSQQDTVAIPLSQLYEHLQRSI